MEPEIMNPDSAMMMQSEGNWQKYFALVLFKLAPNGVNITVDDMKAFGEQPNTVVLTHGHSDSIDFKLIDWKTAKILSDHEATQRGTC